MPVPTTVSTMSIPIPMRTGLVPRLTPNCPDVVIARMMMKGHQRTP